MIRERGLTAIIATHNPQLAALTDRKIPFARGQGWRRSISYVIRNS